MPGPGRGWREASISISSSSSNDHENSNDNGAAQLGQLDVLRDFDAVQTLSSQPHIGASVSRPRRPRRPRLSFRWLNNSIVYRDRSDVYM